MSLDDKPRDARNSWVPERFHTSIPTISDGLVFVVWRGNRPRKSFNWKDNHDYIFLQITPK